MNKKSQQGIALVWVIIATTLLIAGVGLAASRRTALKIKKFQSEAPSLSLLSPSLSPEQVPPSSEEFVGQIKEIIAKGIPMECTYTQEGFTGVSFIKGKKMYSEISGGGGTEYVIVKDNCMWDWHQGESQGTKICFEGDIWETTEEIPAEADYRCMTATFSDSQFEPPAGINFMASGEGMSLSDEDLMKILPPKERAELESAIREAQQVIENMQIFEGPTLDDIKGSLKGLDQMTKQAVEQIQKNMGQQQQNFQPPDIEKMMEKLNQNPPAVPHEGEKEPSLEEQEYYYRKYILKDPAVQY